MVRKEIRKMKFTVIVMTILFTGGLLTTVYSCNKGEESKKSSETQKVESGTKTQSTTMPQPTPAPKSEQETGRMKSHGPPPEITEPCKGLKVGDSCTVIITGGSSIEGSCVMSRAANELACMPKARLVEPNTQKPLPSAPMKKQGE
jgi:hypothetical protein